MIKQQKGFTLIEVVVVVPIIILMIAAIITSMISLSTDNSRSQAAITTNYNVNTALNMIERDVKISSAYLTTIDSKFTDTYGIDSNATPWTYKGSDTNNRALILRSYATDQDIISATKNAVYINQFGCDAINMNSNPLQTTNVIYFVRQSTLYRRTLTDTTSPTCSTQYQQQSCPPDATSRPAACKTDDVIVLTNVSEFIPTYSRDGTLVDAYNSNDQQVLATTDSVSTKIQSGTIVAGEQVAYVNSLDTSRYNGKTFNSPSSASSPVIPSRLSSFSARLGARSINFSWSAATNATSYVFERSSNEAFNNPVTVYSGPNLSYSDTGLSPLTTYYYRLKSVNAGGSSAWSNRRTYTTNASNVIYAGEFLFTGQYLQSPNNRFRLIIQSDGNLVVYDNGAAIWASYPPRSTPSYLAMQTDGNLVTYANDNSGFTWHIGKGGSNHKAYMLDDGNFVVYNGADNPIWDSKGYVPR